jgi:Fasciclin domain
MRIPRRLGAVLVAAGLTGAAVLTPSPASAHSSHPAHLGDRSLAALLTADGNRFDRNWNDYDVVTEAVLAVLAAKPSSPVGVLADGSVPLTAFLPTDRAFQLLVKDLTGRWVKSERGVFEAVAGLGIDTVETVLLYHVVAGKTLASPKVVAAAKKGTRLTTAQGGSVKVTTRKGNIVLVDKDRDLADPTVILDGVDINKGNKQIGHAIDRVLLPVDL